MRQRALQPSLRRALAFGVLAVVAVTIAGAMSSSAHNLLHKQAAADSNTAKSPPPNPETTGTYVTSSNQQATIRLSDGTLVTLASHTPLRRTRFGLASPTVVLGNDAHFRVAHSTGAPFLVRQHISDATLSSLV